MSWWADDLRTLAGQVADGLASLADPAPAAAPSEPGWVEGLEPDFGDLDAGFGLDHVDELDSDPEETQLIRVAFRRGAGAPTYTYACPFPDVEVGQTVVVPATLHGRERAARAVVTEIGSDYAGPVKPVSAVILAGGGGGRRRGRTR
jgi:hypothetical protein